MVLAWVVCGILVLCSGVMIWECSTEHVTMNRRADYFSLERYPFIGINFKYTRLKLSDIVKVHAIHKGFTGETYYCLVVTFATGQQIKVLQTRNTLRIKKYVRSYHSL